MNDLKELLRQTEKLQRHRVNQVTRHMIDLLNGRRHWQSTSLNNPDATGNDSIQLSFKPKGPRHIEINVPAVEYQNWPEHYLTLMEKDFQQFLLHDLSEDEFDTWVILSGKSKAFDLYRWKDEKYLVNNEVDQSFCTIMEKLLLRCSLSRAGRDI